MSEENTTPQVITSEVQGIETKVDAPVEPTSTTETPPPKVEDKFASKFAALSKKEKAIKERESLYSQKDKEYADKEKAYSQWENLRTNAKQNPWAVIKELGIDFNTISEQWMEENTATPESKEIRAIRAEIEALKQEKEEQSVT